MTRTLTVAAAAVARVFTFLRRRLETELVLAFLRVRRFDSPRPPVRKNLECAKSPTFRRPTQLIGSRDRRFVWRLTAVALHERGGTGRRLVRARDHDVGRRRSPGEARVVQPPGHGARQVRGRGSGLVRAPASALQGTVASEDGSHGSPCRFPESLDPPPADRPRPPPPCSPAASPAWRIPLIRRPRTMARAPGPAARTPRNAKRCGASSKI